MAAKYKILTNYYIGKEEDPMNPKEILSRLPGSWEELKLKDFVKLTDLEISESTDLVDKRFNGVDNTIRMISILTDTPVSDLEDLPFHVVAEMGVKLSFMQTPPKSKDKGLLVWKKIEDITYNDFVTYHTFEGKHLQNLPTLIKAFSTTKLTEEQIADLPMSEVMGGFFTLQKQLKKSVRRMQRCIRIQVMKLVVKEMAKNLQPFKRKTAK